MSNILQDLCISKHGAPVKTPSGRVITDQTLKAALTEYHRNPHEFGAPKTSYVSSAYETVRRNAIGKYLAEKLPNWQWAVKIERGVVYIQSLRFPMDHGMRLIDDQIDNDFKAVYRDGCELIERYKMPVGAFREDIYETLPRDFMGELIPYKD